MKKETPTFHRGMDRRGAGANLIFYIIQAIGKLNTWQFGLLLAPFWAWVVQHVR